MKRFSAGVAAFVALSACSGGNPFAPTTGGGTGTGTGAPSIPADLAGDLTSFTYDPVAQTLIVRGVSLDDTPFEAVYTRKPGLDRQGYEAYTSQESSLGRHTTAYVRARDGVSAAITVSGEQFGQYYGGSGYGRDGSYSPPDTTVAGGLVSYAGGYVGLLNAAGSGEDLLPVTPGTPTDILPTQAAEVVGDIFITADFADNTVNGIVYNRVIADTATAVENLELAGAPIDADGTFTGDVTQDAGAQVVGTYGGIFGGTGASAVAGTLFSQGHIGALPGTVEEYGVFVLENCGGAGADPVCTQPRP